MRNNIKSILKASRPCIERLHRYLDAAVRFRQLGLLRVFSDNLSDAVGVTSVQVRKDLSLFGPLGHKRGGYPVEDLIAGLRKVLGKDRSRRVILAGAGNIGRALMRYPEFPGSGITICAAFDIDPAKQGTRVGEVPVLPPEVMPEVVRKERVQVGVLAVPVAAAQEVTEGMIASGIRGVINFAPVHLNVPEDFVVNDIHLGVEIETVLYFVENIRKRRS